MYSNEPPPDPSRNDQPSDEQHLPDIKWCRDPFMEQLNEIEAMDGIKH